MTQLIAQTINDNFIQIVLSGMNPIIIERPSGSDEDPAVIEFLNMKALCLDCLESDDWEKFVQTLYPTIDISALTTHNDLVFERGTIAYKGYTLQNGLVARIVGLCKEHAQEGKDSLKDMEVKKLVALLDKLMGNTSKRVVDNLWTLLSTHNVPVMQNGNVLMYGDLDEDGLLHGTLKANEKGVIKRPRNMVNDVAVDSTMFLSIPSDFGKTVGVFKVNPKNIVYVGSRAVSVCKMKQIDIIKGE